MKKNILAISRDRGSMQAIAPVVLALAAYENINVSTMTTCESSHVIRQSGICPILIDEAAFAAEPMDYISSIFDVHNPNLILSGFSPARGHIPETPEQYSIIEAHRRGLTSVTVQDFWGMYVERLSRDGHSLSEDLLPNRLCVLDRHAFLELETFGVPKDLMAITHNPWFDNLAGMHNLEPRTKRHTNEIEVLYASQPLASMQYIRQWPYDQYTIFRYLLDAMPVAKHGAPLSTIRILPHPLENNAEWTKLISRVDRKDVRIELCNSREPNLLRNADYLVTSHSTLAYDALYFGTPCISLRPEASDIMHLWIEDIGLSHVFQDVDSLRRYLDLNDPVVERQRILKLKNELTAERLFFSDGTATRRVMDEIAKLLGDPNFFLKN